MNRPPALLVLDDGTCFEGTACGACQEAQGEVIFTTSPTGYQETLTDPSYHGQIITFTAAHLGNYGASASDDQSTGPRAEGAIFHELTSDDAFRHWHADESLDARMARAGMTGIQGIDTRALTLHLRTHGARNGIISALDLDRDSLLKRARALPSMSHRDLARVVTCKSGYLHPAAENVPGLLPIAVYDFGVKRSILDQLVRVGFAPHVWPATTPAETVLASKPRGIFLSNGPGDPAACGYAIEAVRTLLEKKAPLFGICLGHQILALALGAQTYKLKFGHHGMNHPVKDLDTGRVLITSQNHGFCVDPASLPKTARVSHWNLNDETVEGLVCTDAPAFSVQFHPEAAPGPNDATYLFDRFRKLIAD